MRASSSQEDKEFERYLIESGFNNKRLLDSLFQKSQKSREEIKDVFKQEKKD